ncbi:MAG: DUF2207 domain-containing protein [Verrucomicrobiales bacterium]|nr:DUF2207 domain-containing protein [Verrucomicrobiales bacterium]
MKRRILYAMVMIVAANLSFAAQTALPEGDEAKDAIKSLRVSVRVDRNGKIDVEQDFVISLSGNGIKRGPILSYVTVYKGIGGLVLDQKMQVQEVLRNGQVEPFSVLSQGGVTQITCGSSDVFLERKEQRYTIRYTRIGSWSFRDGMANWAYEVTESFRSYRIDEVNFNLQLPDGVELANFTTGLSGSESTGTGYLLKEAKGKADVASTAPLRPQAFMFVNASWKASSFATKSQWIEVLTQHPKLPISAFSAIILFSLLIHLLNRLIKSRRVKTVPLP